MPRFDKIKMSTDILLTKEQQEIYKYIRNGHNILITGPGGTGKTTLIKYIVKTSNDLNNTFIGVTATTGTAAVLINGRTLHSYLSIGLGKESQEELLKKVKRDNWLRMTMLIIDEISMLSATLFNKLNYLGKNIRNSDKPFGGIQLVLCGDFLQLPVIDGEFCFLSASWKEECNIKIFELTKILRQPDEMFQKCLNSARFGELTEEELTYIINGYVKSEDGIKPTKILCCNDDVSIINNYELMKTNSEIVEYEMDISYNRSVYNPDIHKNLFKNIGILCNASPTLELAVGAQVLHLVNIPDTNIVNGSRGVVIAFQDDNPVVRFKNGEVLTISYHGYEVTEYTASKKRLIATIYQIPLKLAYAITVHKSQGMTIDSAIIDLRRVFEYGQAYVALSRVKDVKHLQLLNATVGSFKANPKALAFYANVSENH